MWWTYCKSFIWPRTVWGKTLKPSDDGLVLLFGWVGWVTKRWKTNTSKLRKTCLSERMSEWASQWLIEWVSEWVREWMGEWVSEWMSAWVSEWVSGWTRDWGSEWVNERTGEGVRVGWKGERETYPISIIGNKLEISLLNSWRLNSRSCKMNKKVNKKIETQNMCNHFRESNFFPSLSTFSSQCVCVWSACVCVRVFVCLCVMLCVVAGRWSSRLIGFHSFSGWCFHHPPQQKLKQVDTFKYLGRQFESTHSLDADISNRLKKASGSFLRFKTNLYSRKEISTKTKLRISKIQALPCHPCSMALGGWAVLIRHTRRLESFHMRCLRYILRVTFATQWEGVTRQHPPPVWHPPYHRPAAHQPPSMARSCLPNGWEPTPPQGSLLPPQRRPTSRRPQNHLEGSHRKRPRPPTPVRHVARQCHWPEIVEKNHSSGAAKSIILPLLQLAFIDAPTTRVPLSPWTSRIEEIKTHANQWNGKWMLCVWFCVWVILSLGVCVCVFSSQDHHVKHFSIASDFEIRPDFPDNFSHTLTSLNSSLKRKPHDLPTKNSSMTFDTLVHVQNRANQRRQFSNQFCPLLKPPNHFCSFWDIGFPNKVNRHSSKWVCSKPAVRIIFHTRTNAPTQRYPRTQTYTGTTDTLLVCTFTRSLVFSKDKLAPYTLKSTHSKLFLGKMTQLSWECVFAQIPILRRNDVHNVKVLQFEFRQDLIDDYNEFPVQIEWKHRIEHEELIDIVFNLRFRGEKREEKQALSKLWPFCELVNMRLWGKKDGFRNKTRKTRVNFKNNRCFCFCFLWKLCCSFLRHWWTKPHRAREEFRPCFGEIWVTSNSEWVSRWRKFTFSVPICEEKFQCRALDQANKSQTQMLTLRPCYSPSLKINWLALFEDQEISHLSQVEWAGCLTLSVLVWVCVRVLCVRVCLLCVRFYCTGMYLCMCVGVSLSHYFSTCVHGICVDLTGGCWSLWMR